MKNEEKTEVLEVVDKNVPKVETVAKTEEVPASVPPAPANTTPAPQPAVTPKQAAAPAKSPAPAKVETPQPKQPLPEEPHKIGAFKIFLLIVLFIILWGVAFYLPEITKFIESRNKGNETKEITTGTLVCNYKNKSPSGSKEIEARFAFAENKLKRVDMTFVTENDDEKKIQQVMEKCELVSTEVVSLKGIEIKCNESEGKIVQTEKIDYANFDQSEIGPGFAEAGGTYPKFDFDENIDKVNKEMVKAEYSCNKKE